VLVDDPARFAFGRANEKTRPARGQNSVKLARHDEAAGFGQHGDEMNVRHAENGGKLMARLSREKSNIREIQGGGLCLERL